MSVRAASSLLKNVWFAAWGHAAYKISSEIGINCRPGALTGLFFQRAPKPRPKSFAKFGRANDYWTRNFPGRMVNYSSNYGAIFLQGSAQVW